MCRGTKRNGERVWSSRGCTHGQGEAVCWERVRGAFEREEDKAERIGEGIQRESVDKEVLEGVQIRVCVFMGQDGVEGDQGEDEGMGGIYKHTKAASGAEVQNSG